MLRSYLEPWALSSLVAITSVSDLPGQGPVVVTMLDQQGVYIDLDSNPTPTAGDGVVEPGNELIQRRTPGQATSEYRGVLAEFDLSGLNPDGIFAARVTGTVSAEPSAGIAEVRDFGTGLYRGDGMVQAADVFEASVAATDSFIPTFSLNTATDASVNFTRDVTFELRDIARGGSAAMGVKVQGTNTHAGISSLNPISLEVTEYFANPFDSVPDIGTMSGLAFRGQQQEFVSNGETKLFEDLESTFEVRRNGDNSLTGYVNLNAGIGREFWFLRIAAPDDALLQAGDSFTNAGDYPFHADGEAGLSFSGDGRAFSTSTGGFTVHQLVYGAGNTVESLDVEFFAREANRLGAPSMFGRYQFNVVAVPEPTTGLALLMGGAAVIAWRRHRTRPDSHRLASPRLIGGSRSSVRLTVEPCFGWPAAFLTVRICFVVPQRHSCLRRPCRDRSDRAALDRAPRASQGCVPLDYILDQAFRIQPQPNAGAPLVVAGDAYPGRHCHGNSAGTTGHSPIAVVNLAYHRNDRRRGRGNAGDGFGGDREGSIEKRVGRIIEWRSGCHRRGGNLGDLHACVGAIGVDR
nr:PEP-CTERM sorting domain-containing protein [Rubripirellula tenax]